MPHTENLKPFGSGKFTEEEEREIRIKGAQTMHRQRREKQTAAELFSLALSSEVKDRDILKLVKAFGMEGKTVDVALVASVLKNAMRKGTVSDALEAFTAAGRTENATDEAAHAAFLHALTASTDDKPEDRGTRQGCEVPTPPPEK